MQRLILSLFKLRQNIQYVCVMSTLNEIIGWFFKKLFDNFSSNESILKIYPYLIDSIT